MLYYFYMQVSKDFTFDAAHFLTKYYGKCEHLHGHTYKLRVIVEGDIQSNGLVIDFVVLKRIVKKHVLDVVDHRLLNDIIENPSAERLIVWIWKKLQNLPNLLREELDDPNIAEELRKYFKEHGELDLSQSTDTIRLVELQLWETADSSVIYRGEQVNVEF